MSAALANDDFTAREATVKLEIGGDNRTEADVTVPTTGNVSPPFSDLPFDRKDLIGNYSLAHDTAHDYTLYLVDSEDDVVDQTTGRFFFEDADGGNVTFFDDSHALEDDEDTLLVNATLINTLPNETEETIEFQIVDDEVNMPDAEGEPIIVPAYNGTKGISYEANVSQLRAGTYDYELRHDGVTLERNFTIHDSLENSGSIVGDLRVEAIHPASDVIENGEDFEIDVQLYNTAENATETDVSLDLLDGSLSTTLEDEEIDGTTRKNVTVELDGEEIDEELPTRTEHEYEVTVDNAGETESFPGSFLVLEPKNSLQIDDYGTEKDGDWRWINATLANHGNDTGSATATLTLYDNETDTEVGSVPTEDAIELGPANQTTLPFGFNASEFDGAYRYEVSYGEETVEGYFSEGEADTGDGNVSITEPGTGTVKVLGTEVSAYSEGNCSDFGCYPPPQKSWASTTVSTILETDGEETVTPFTNTAAADSYHNEQNLNTYDSQKAVYTYNWTQVEGEPATLTVSSSYWGLQDTDVVNTRDSGIEDLQPDYDVMQWSDPENTVNANSGTNKEAVQVLTDGDEVPNPQTSGEDQRSAAEILNQGAADRIDDNGTLDLGPYEAVFLFEMTNSTDQVPGNMWEYALENEVSDPDYNDVIALVEFESDGGGTVPVEMNTTEDGSGLVIGTPSVSGDGGGSATIGDVETTEGDGATDGAEPEAPGSGVGEPSPPGDVNVEVDVIQIG